MLSSLIWIIGILKRSDFRPDFPAYFFKKTIFNHNSLPSKYLRKMFKKFQKSC